MQCRYCCPACCNAQAVGPACGHSHWRPRGTFLAYFISMCHCPLCKLHAAACAQSFEHHVALRNVRRPSDANDMKRHSQCQWLHASQFHTAAHSSTVSSTYALSIGRIIYTLGNTPSTVVCNARLNPAKTYCTYCRHRHPPHHFYAGSQPRPSSLHCGQLCPEVSPPP